MSVRFINRCSGQLSTSQRGGMLIESLIGMLILGLVGAGIMHSTARMAVAQREMTVQTIAVSQMRSMLMTGKNAAGGDICSAAPTINLPGNQSPVDVTVKGCAEVPMTISGITIDGAAQTKTINAARPRVFEIGSDGDMVRIGGKI